MYKKNDLMVITEIEEKCVRGGEIQLPWKRLESVAKGNPLLSKMGWTKENRNEIRKVLQKLPLPKLVRLFSSQCKKVQVFFLKMDLFKFLLVFLTCH